MLKTRKLHRNEQDKEKLYGALRELYNDGVRVFTGRLPADELIKRKIGSEHNADAARAHDTLRLADDPATGHNPYNREFF